MSLRRSARRTRGSAARDPPPAPASPSGGDHDGGDPEATQQPRGKKRRPRKTSRTSTVSQPSKHPRKEPGQDGAATAGNPENNTLFQAVTSGRAALEAVVDDWLESYRRDRQEAFLELLNFIVRSCGCKGEVTPDMLHQLKNFEIIQQLTMKFDEDSLEYPLSRKTLPWRRFRAGFSELLSTLLLRVQHSVLYDGVLVSPLLTLLISLSDSQVRAFRHTSTLAAMKVMSALVEVALGLSQRQENNQRQYEAERRKRPERRSADRLEELLEKGRELREQQQEVEQMMNDIFKGVFVHRYRDVVPDIRAICMEELGRWMRRYPASFLTDGHLKYLGWMLHDRVSEVRLQCVKALQGVYGHRDTASQLELFTSHFKERMLAMVLDKNTEVALEMIKLLTTMLETAEELLTESDCLRVFPLIYVASRPVASAAGLFLFRRVLDPQRGTGSGDGDNGTFFQRLLNFFIESEMHEHTVYLVDSLWDCAGPRLRDWDTISSLLLDKSPGIDLSNQQEKALVDILAASVAQTARGRPPVGRELAKKPSAREQKAQGEERTRLTHCLVPVLPKLLIKFLPDTEKVIPLMEMLQSFDLGVCRKGRLEKHVELVLGQLQEVMEKHSEAEVLGAAARALHVLCDPRLPPRARGDLVRSRLVDRLARSCHRDVAKLVQNKSMDEDEFYSMEAMLRRISALFSAHDLTPWELFQPCAQLLQYGVDTGEVPPKVLVPTITCLHYHILWELSHLPDTNVPKVISCVQEQLQGLKSKVVTVTPLFQNCLTDPSALIREQAFAVLSDELLMLGPRLPEDGREELAPLVLVAEPELQALMAAFLLDHVFQEPMDPQQPLSLEGTERYVLDLTQRRVLLTAFCKLLMYRVLESHAATDVFKRYDKFYDVYGDIIKETMSSIRQVDRQEWARVLLLTLQQAMSEQLLDQGREIRGSEEFQELKALARRFSLFFSPPQPQNRPLLLPLLRDGIQFAFEDPPKSRIQVGSQEAPEVRKKQPPLNLPFLELLSEFSPRLMNADKTLFLAYLDNTIQKLGWTSPSWPSLLAYRRSLQPQEKEGQSFSPPSSPAAKKPRADSNAPSGSSSLPSSLLSGLAFTSTMLMEGPSRNPRGPHWSQDSISEPSSILQRLSLMEEEKKEEEETPGPSRAQRRDLLDCTLLGMEVMRGTPGGPPRGRGTLQKPREPPQKGSKLKHPQRRES